MLEKIACLFEVPVSTLLGNTIPENNTSSQNEDIVKQLAILNEQLASQSRSKKRTTKILLISIVAILILSLTIIITAFSAFSYKISTGSSKEPKVEISVSSDNNEYCYKVSFDENNQITELFGDYWIAERIHPDQYDDMNDLIAEMENYFMSHNLKYEILWIN